MTSEPAMTRRRSARPKIKVIVPTTPPDDTDSVEEPGADDESDYVDDVQVTYSRTTVAADDDGAYYRRYEKEFDEAALTRRPYSDKTMGLLGLVEKLWTS